MRKDKICFKANDNIEALFHISWHKTKDAHIQFVQHIGYRASKPLSIALMVPNMTEFRQILAAVIFSTSLKINKTTLIDYSAQDKRVPFRNSLAEVLRNRYHATENHDKLY